MDPLARISLDLEKMMTEAATELGDPPQPKPDRSYGDWPFADYASLSDLADGSLDFMLQYVIGRVTGAALETSDDECQPLNRLGYSILRSVKSLHIFKNAIEKKDFETGLTFAMEYIGSIHECERIIEESLGSHKTTEFRWGIVAAWRKAWAEIKSQPKPAAVYEKLDPNIFETKEELKNQYGITHKKDEPAFRLRGYYELHSTKHWTHLPALKKTIERWGLNKGLPG